MQAIASCIRLARSCDFWTVVSMATNPALNNARSCPRLSIIPDPEREPDHDILKCPAAAVALVQLRVFFPAFERCRVSCNQLLTHRYILGNDGNEINADVLLIFVFFPD